MRELCYKTVGRMSFVEITNDINRLLLEEKVDKGTVVIFVPHTTAAITINENADSDVTMDMKVILNQLIPWDGPYKHLEGNSAAHMMASLIGASETIIVNKGKAVLGTWQGIYLVDFDGPRERKVLVSIQT
ncbi:secondary thiamine-phosphate synthase enzyme [Desulfitispora alkaliphila]|uniref:secondary thiamine-phosphate synthase enzyme YjbQ n=1 Tax=Desulfitispora alkaliphila TaxID=622674 RepID=UPI003D254444